MNYPTNEDRRGGLIALIVMLLWVPSAFWISHVVRLLWEWSAVEWLGWPSVTLPVVVAAMTLWFLFTAKFKNTKKDDDNSPVVTLMARNLVAAIMLGTAALARQLFGA